MKIDDYLGVVVRWGKKLIFGLGVIVKGGKIDDYLRVVVKCGQNVMFGWGLIVKGGGKMGSKM